MMVRADTRFCPPTSDRHCKPRTDSAPAGTVFARVYSDSSELDDDEWPIRCILQETDTEYLIDWEGSYDPSWEPKENASELAVQTWEEKKARRAPDTNSGLQVKRDISQVHGPASPSASRKRRRDLEDNQREASEHENQPSTRGPTAFLSSSSPLEIVPETQYSPQARQSAVSGSFSPETPGAGHSSVRSEIGETPSPRHEEFKRQFIPHESSLPLSASLGSVEGIECNLSSLVSHYLTQGDSSAGVYFNSIPETVTQDLSQYRLDSGSQRTSQPALALSEPTETQPPVELVEDQGRKHPAASKNETMDQYNSWGQPRAPHFPGISQTLSASATPSSVGDIEASVPVPVPEATAPLSVRHDKDAVTHSHTSIHHVHPEPLIPPSELLHTEQSTMQTIQPSELTVTNIEENLPGSIRLGPSEFAVTLPMDSRVKDYYERVLADAATSIREFFSGVDDNSGLSAAKREELLSKMHEMLTQLNNVSTHPDLNIPEYLKGTESHLAEEGLWAEYSSAKFLFLGYLIEVASLLDWHFILRVHDDKAQRMLERYLQGKGFAYTRPREEMGGALEISMAKENLSFGIHSTDSVTDLYKPPIAILALTPSVNLRSICMQHIRTTYTRNESLLPVIWLFVANASEHIEHCLPDLPSLDRLRLLIQYTADLHDAVGDLQDDALGVHEDVDGIVSFLLDIFEPWPLALIEPLHAVSMEESDEPISSSDEPAAPSQKRGLDEEIGLQTSKRARVDASQEISQLTQSSKHMSQTLDRDLQSLEKNLVQMKSDLTTEKEQLRKELTQTLSRFQELETAMSVLQHRYESRYKEFHKMRHERDYLTESKTALEQRIETQKESITKLKDERTQLKRDLEQARQELKEGGGSVAELETAREEIRRLEKEKASLERKADYERNQADYTREQYQNASTAAAQSGTEARQLQEENEDLKRKVEGNAIRLRELNIQNDTARHLARVEELELTLAARDDLLRKKEEELREIRKNRPSTRSTSTQPRSPKWAATSRPTSPGANGNGNNGLPGRGSALRFSAERPF